MTTTLHQKDVKVFILFIDYARLQKSENVELEIITRLRARRYGLNINTSNKALANSIERKILTV